MTRQRTLLALAMLAPMCLFLSGQRQAVESVFTSAQAEAGRVDYINTCARCHTYTLLGRKGAQGELPPVSTLSEADRKFVGNPVHVPPLAGEAFLNRWGDKTASQLIARFQITVSDPNFQFKNITSDSTVNITAYILQMNGAKAGVQPLTRTTDAVVNSLMK